MTVAWYHMVPVLSHVIFGPPYVMHMRMHAAQTLKTTCNQTNPAQNPATDPSESLL